MGQCPCVGTAVSKDNFTSRKIQGPEFALGPYGGHTGAEQTFSDATYRQYGYPTVIRLGKAALIDSIKIWYGDKEGPHHGGEGGSQTDIVLGADEYINKVKGSTWDKYTPGKPVLESLTFCTNKGLIFGRYGGKNGTSFTADPGNPNARLVYISGGTSGWVTDYIVFHFETDEFIMGPYGGVVEKAHSDVEAFSDASYRQCGYPSIIRLGKAALVDSIKIWYGNTEGPHHGGQGGSQTDVVLDAEEYINKVEGSTSDKYTAGQPVLECLTFYTNKGQIFGPYGGNTGASFTADPGNPNARLVYISGGTSGWVTDHIAFHFETYECIRGPYGSTGKKVVAFSDATYRQCGYPSKIRLGKASLIDSIKIWYGDKEGPHHGGQGGRQTDIDLGPDEFINKVKGSTSDKYTSGQPLLESLTFCTNKGHVFGRYGGKNGASFTADPGNPNARLVYISGGTSGWVTDCIAFHYETDESIMGPYGSGIEESNSHMEAFSDATYRQYGYPTIIRLGKAALIDSIKIWYGDKEGPHHGGQGGRKTDIVLGADEYINKVEGHTSDNYTPGQPVVESLTFYTNKGHTFGRYGGNNGPPFTADPGNPNARLVYISGGTSGWVTDNIAFHFAIKECIIGPYGGRGGTAFTDSDLQNHGFPTLIKLKLTEHIDGIQVCYGSVQGPHHGGESGVTVEFPLEADEYINKVGGSTAPWKGATSLQQINFFTNKGRIYGPFGPPGGQPFTADPDNSNARLSYISGNASDVLDSITFHFVDG